jgi:hypothetical protein
MCCFYVDNFPKDLQIFHALGKKNPVVKFFGVDNIALVNGEKWKKQRKVKPKKKESGDL